MHGETIKLMLICLRNALVGLIDKLHKMHGTYIKIVISKVNNNRYCVLDGSYLNEVSSI